MTNTPVIISGTSARHPEAVSCLCSLSCSATSSAGRYVASPRISQNTSWIRQSKVELSVAKRGYFTTSEDVLAAVDANGTDHEGNYRAPREIAAEYVAVEKVVSLVNRLGL